MTILNLGKFVSTLSAMQSTLEVQSGTASNKGGWQLPGTQNTPREVVRVDALSALSVLTNGDGVLRTFDVAQEIIHEGLSSKALTGSHGLWFDGEVHRQLNPRMQLVSDVLIEAVQQIAGDDKVNLENYLLHLNDLDANASMVRPQGQNFSYFASQMAIIDPKGNMHFLSMDRVKNSAVSYLSYAWRAVAVEDHEVSIQHDDRPRLLVRIEPATHYIKLGDKRIAMFSRKFNSLTSIRSGLAEYAYRAVQRESVALVRPFNRSSSMERNAL
jgi:hypothetical protein